MIWKWDEEGEAGEGDDDDDEEAEEEEERETAKQESGPLYLRRGACHRIMTNGGTHWLA